MERPAEIPATLWAQICKRATPPPNGRPVSLMNAMHVKRDLRQALPMESAVAVYAKLMSLAPGCRTVEMEIAPLESALEAGAGPVTRLNCGGAPLSNRAPVTYGPAQVPGFDNRGRRVLSGWLHGATVFGRSALIAQEGRLLLDATAEERVALPVELAFDPIVFERSAPDRAQVLVETGAPRRRFPRALSMLGINSVSFGHWMMEHLPQFLAAQAALGVDLSMPDGARLPVLIDTHMPRQHVQSLRFFAGAQGLDLVEVGKGEAVEVAQLFVTQNWMHAPHLLLTDQGLDIAALHPTAIGLAGTYRAVSDRVETLVASGDAAEAPAERLFWARKPNRHRAIDNWDEIRGKLEALGYKTCFPEDLSFDEQIRAIRGARRIAVQNGSGSLGLFLAAAGTRLLYLSHPDMSRLAMQVEAHAQTGVEMRVLAGSFSRRTDRWVDQSNYRIAEPDFDAAMAWLDAPMQEGAP
ncbi:MAG: glycosyltransferase family 61 protein [Pseudomonadota bacterium]